TPRVTRGVARARPRAVAARAAPGARASRAAPRGPLLLSRAPAELDAGVSRRALLAEHGQKQEVLDGAALARLDPVFEPVRNKIAGAIRDVGDSSGDSRRFVEHLALRCQERLGVGIRLGTRVSALRADGD